MNNSIAGANDAVNISLYNGTPNEALNALRYMRFCEQVSCQTVHG